MTQMSVTGILAVGMLMVIVSGNIDLSVGSVLGFAGGIAAYAHDGAGVRAAGRDHCWRSWSVSR